ncbi:M48 family metalloprotease [Streptococcus dentasini]
MYLINFIKRMSRKSNIPVLIYLALNVFIIAIIIQVMFSDSHFIQSFFLALALYAVSMFIALSPIGEWILRLQTGCKPIKRVEYSNYIEPLFQEVYTKARAMDTSIPEDIQLFMNEDEAPNAFATGRKTICITEGLLSVPESQIKATLAHEFGHLAHKDTDLILVVSVGNMIVSSIIIFIRLAIDLFHFIFYTISSLAGGQEGAIVALISTIYHLLITAVEVSLTKLWTWIGILFVMKSSRANEYEADEFAYRLGYGNDLCILLDTIDTSGAQGLFASLSSSHPSKNDRIARLQNLGATYQRSFK